MSGRAKGISGSGLKAIAAVTMFIDHIGAAILESPVLARAVAGEEADAFFNSAALSGVRTADFLLRFIGRVSFPIFCFLLVEGFLHTRSLARYMGRLAVFALLSEIPYDLAFYGAWFDPGDQNIFFTLLLGLAAVAALARFGERNPLGLLAALGCALLAEYLRTDYGAFGVALILLFYLLRDRPKLRTVAGSLALCWEITAPLAFIPIWMYDGTRGKRHPKYFFYLFYPAHILLLWLVRVMLYGG